MESEFSILPCQDPACWTFLAEGFDSIIFRYISDANLELDGKVLRLFKNQNEGHRRGGAKPLEDFRDKVKLQMKFNSQFVEPYLPALDAGTPVTVSPDFVSKLAEITESKRSAKRIAESCVCITSTVGLLHNNHILPDSLVVEIKPKWGFCPDCPLLPDDSITHKISRFQLLQRTKLKKGDIKTISDYDPLDLFSGTETGVRKALESMCKNPQGNLKVFRNRESSNLTSEEISALVPLLAHSEILKQLLALQKLDVWDIECLEPIVYKALDAKWSDFVDNQGIIDGVKEMIETKFSLPKTASECQLIIDIMTCEEARKFIAAFLVSQAAKDCSLMILFKDGKVHDPEYHAIDFDMKLPELLISQYLKTTKKVVATYLEME